MAGEWGWVDDELLDPLVEWTRPSINFAVRSGGEALPHKSLDSDRRLVPVTSVKATVGKADFKAGLPPPTGLQLGDAADSRAGGRACRRDSRSPIGCGRHRGGKGYFTMGGG